jgi:hypothetical protein
MVWRLMVDFVRREWRQYTPCLMFVAVWPVPVVRRASDATAIALAMAMTVAIANPIVERFVRREIFLLPVSSRQLWLARWWLGVAGAVAWTELVKLTAWRGEAFAVVSLLCDVAYVGATLALWTLLDVRPRGAVWLRRAVIRGQMILWLLLAVGTIVWPFLLRAVLPVTFDDLAGVKGIGLATALALTAWGYLHTPSPEAPRQVVRTRVESGGRRTISGQRTNAPTAISRAPTTPVLLSGVAYHLVRDAAVAIAYAAVVVSGLFVVAFALQPTGGLRPALDRVVDSVASGDAFPALGLLLLLLISSVPAGLHWQRAVRLMRVLPMKPAYLVALLLAVPLWRWVAFWLLGFVLKALAGRPGGLFPLDGLLALTGIAALMQAISFRWSGARPAALIAIVTVGLIIASTALSVMGEIAATAAGLGISLATTTAMTTLGAAALLDYHTLTRRTATFRRPVTAGVTPI